MRPPKAHVTLARPQRSATLSQREAALVWAKALRLRDVRVRLGAPALYTWAEDRSRALFRIVTTRP